LARRMHRSSNVGIPHQQQKEHRQHQRELLSVPVLIDIGSKWLRANCRDVSTGGLRIENEPLPLGREVELYIELPTQVAVEAHARVVRNDGTTVALRFVELNPEARHAISDFCRRRRLQRSVSATLRLAVPDRIVLS